MNESQVGEPDVAAGILKALRGLLPQPSMPRTDLLSKCLAWSFMLDDEQMVLDDQILQLQHGRVSWATTLPCSRCVICSHPIIVLSIMRHSQP